MPSINTQFLSLAVVVASLVASTVAIDCPRGGVSNTTAVRKTYPVPPIVIYPVTGDFFNTKWSDLRTFDYEGETHPKSKNKSEILAPNATRSIEFEGFEFREQLIFINDTAPEEMFNLKWNLTNPPSTKDGTKLVIDAYIQDFKFTTACEGKASLIEWTVEYCANDQDAGWDLFQDRTTREADNLAIALNVTGADDGTWDVGCAIPTTTSTTRRPTATPGPSETDGLATTTGSQTSETDSPNAGAMVTPMPVYGGAIALILAAAAVI